MIVQNQNNPLAPVTGPSADQLLNAFEQHAAALRGEGQAQSTLTPTNPFKANVGQQDAQQEHIAKMEQYAAPIGVNIFDTQSDYTDEKHKRFADTLDKDPAFKEIEGPYYQFVTALRADVQAGKVSQQDAASILADYGQNEIDPILDKHHGPHSASHKVSLHSKGGE
ncbi:hypothetical protein [Klebsiella variicola]|uniref:hypothetical protein n=1 Tax=Klebsiella variicola TaxID=244366 RepID=UPI002404C28F|nr:hypothetical protein [Klebsiella variicola]MDG0490084.1 hypothetical protein [Klebsiella variicola]